MAVNTWWRHSRRNVPTTKGKEIFFDSLLASQQWVFVSRLQGCQKPTVTSCIMRWVFNLQFCCSDSVVFISGMSVLNVIPSVIRLKLPSHQMPAWSSGISQFEVSLFCHADPTPKRTGASNCPGVSQEDLSTKNGARTENLWAGWILINNLKRAVADFILMQLSVSYNLF